MGLDAISRLTRSGMAIGLLFVAVALALLAAPPGRARADEAPTVWLCRPGTEPDPCLESRTATVVTYSGETRHETIEQPVPPTGAPVDCFYVYPTVSEQEGPLANYEIEPTETQIAIDQASRFSQVCNVYAPIYPQFTLKAENPPLRDILKPYEAVRSAFQEYLARYNDGRGIVLIGHSQGAAVLKALLHLEIEGNPALRAKLVSAIILGGQVEVPKGKLVGGSFENIPPCLTATEIRCVIAYSSFLHEPPKKSLFGHPAAGKKVVCVNPTLTTQDGLAGWLLPYASTTALPDELAPPAPEASTPWIAEPGLATARCVTRKKATWLQVTLAPMSEAVAEERASKHELPLETQPEWGLHVYDVNEALGNLVGTVATQEQTYASEG